jgi:hypothetical protein
MWMRLESEVVLFRFCVQRFALRGIPAGIDLEEGRWSRKRDVIQAHDLDHSLNKPPTAHKRPQVNAVRFPLAFFSGNFVAGFCP